MTRTRLPLLELFLQLRESLGLGLAEYFDALRALAVGLGAGSRQELCWMCQALWATSPEEQQHVAVAVNAMLPEPSLGEAAQYSPEAISEDREHDWSEEGPVPPGQAARRGGSLPADGELVEVKQVVGFGPVGAHADVSPLARGPGEDRSVRPSHFDLSGDLPVTRRYMKRAWRYFRRMQRTGPVTELDVDATTMRLARSGVLAYPVLTPRRRNMASALILVDSGGSMTPFRRITRALVDSARHAGFARLEVLYFQNVPEESVFEDPALRGPRPLAAALESLGEAGLLVISDAGAARGHSSRSRIEKTGHFVTLVRRYGLRMAWMNPVPRSRWASTSAEAIRTRCGVAMFPLERAGLDAAMDVLRGRGVG